MNWTDMILAALNSKLMRFADSLLGAGGEIVKIWHSKKIKLRSKEK